MYKLNFKTLFNPYQFRVRSTSDTNAQTSWFLFELDCSFLGRFFFGWRFFWRFSWRFGGWSGGWWHWSNWTCRSSSGRWCRNWQEKHGKILKKIATYSLNCWNLVDVFPKWYFLLYIKIMSYFQKLVPGKLVHYIPTFLVWSTSINWLTMEIRTVFPKTKNNTRQESSLIHSASPQSRPAVIVAWFWSFGTDGRTDWRTLCVKRVITTGRDCGRPRGSIKKYPPLRSNKEFAFIHTVTILSPSNLLSSFSFGSSTSVVVDIGGFSLAWISSAGLTAKIRTLPDECFRIAVT